MQTTSLSVSTPLVETSMSCCICSMDFKLNDWHSSHLDGKYVRLIAHLKRIILYIHGARVTKFLICRSQTWTSNMPDSLNSGQFSGNCLHFLRFQCYIWLVVHPNCRLLYQLLQLPCGTVQVQRLRTGLGGYGWRTAQAYSAQVGALLALSVLGILIL